MVNYSVSKFSLVAASMNFYYFSNIPGYQKSQFLFTKAAISTLRTMSWLDFGLSKFRASFKHTRHRVELVTYLFISSCTVAIQQH